MGGITFVAIVVFFATIAAIFIVSQFVGTRDNWVKERLRDDLPKKQSKSGKGKQNNRLAFLTQSALPSLGKALQPKKEEEIGQLQARILAAGLYQRHAVSVFLGIKAVAMAVPLLVGLVVLWLDIFPFMNALTGVLAAVAAGMILPGVILDRMKNKRQAALRRALPDALDMIGLCVEAGMSLPAAFRLIVRELKSIHPVLVSELEIVQGESTLGRSTGEALTHFAKRSGVEEVRTLASVVLQAERLGSSLARVLKVTSDMLRQKRIQRAEEAAHKASTKIIFPTIFCIFPAIFLVILGPAVIQMDGTFLRGQ